MANEQADPSESISKSEFAKLLADPAGEVIRYRSIGFAAVTLCCCLFWLLVGLHGYERQELHCDRATNSCVVQVDGPLTHEKTSPPLDSVTGVRDFVKRTRGSRGSLTTCELEIETTTGPVSLVRDIYEEDAPCEQTERFAQECRAFLEDPAQPRLDAGYGPVDSWGLLRLFLWGSFIFFLVSRDSLAVAVSPTFGVVGVSSLAVGCWRTCVSFPLASIDRCTIDGRKSKSYLALLLTTGKHWKLSKEDPFHRRGRRRFTATLNEALERGRRRASARAVSDAG